MFSSHVKIIKSYPLLDFYVPGCLPLANLEPPTHQFSGRRTKATPHLGRGFQHFLIPLQLLLLVTGRRQAHSGPSKTTALRLHGRRKS